MSGAKPFAISKQEVWKAYLQVKSNGGAAGVDAESIEAFEQDRKRNLYLSIGSGIAWRRGRTVRRRCGRWGFRSGMGARGSWGFRP